MNNNEKDNIIEKNDPKDLFLEHKYTVLGGYLYYY